jgi:hypothetical protein
MKRLIHTLILATVLPFAAMTQTVGWLDSVAQQTTPNVDMSHEIADIEYKIYEIKQDSSKAYLDSVNKPHYVAFCAESNKKYLAYLARLDSVCAVWLATKTIVISSLPPSNYFEFDPSEDSTKLLVLYFRDSRCDHTEGFGWNSAALCLPDSFDFNQYENLLRCIDLGMIIIVNPVGGGEKGGMKVQRINYNTVNKAEQAEKLLFQINQILKLAQHEPKLKGLPTPAQYATWEKSKNFASLDETIKSRTNVLLKLSEKL